MPVRDSPGEHTATHTRRQALGTIAGALAAFGAGGTAIAQDSTTMLTDRTTITDAGTYALGADLAIDGHAIRIEADDVVLAGNGHTISGYHGTGVIVDTATNVELHDLRLERTDAPIAFEGATHCRLTDATIVDSEAPVLIRNSTDVQVADTTIAEILGGGVLVEGGSNNEFHRNEIRDNDGDGIWLRSTTHATITDNTIADNWYGINVDEESAHAVITGNTTAGNDRGIRVAGPDHELSDNDSPDGIEILDEHSTDDPQDLESTEDTTLGCD